MRGAIVLLACASLLAACGEPGGERADFAPVHYADRDQVSMNDRCPVRHDPLRDQIEPVYVNGRPLGFC